MIKYTPMLSGGSGCIVQYVNGLTNMIKWAPTYYTQQPQFWKPVF